MVKVIKAAPMGVPDIVRFHDLTGTGTAPAFNPVGITGAPPSPLGVAKEAVNSIDQWINIADKGITLLGRVDSILGRVQTLQRPGGPAPAQPVPVMQHAVPPDMIINADPAHTPPPVQQTPPGDPDPAIGAIVDGRPVMITGSEMAKLQSPRVPVCVIVQALDTVERLQPGITVAQLSNTIKKQPDQVQKLLDVFAAGVT